MKFYLVPPAPSIGTIRTTGIVAFCNKDLTLARALAHALNNNIRWEEIEQIIIRRFLEKDILPSRTAKSRYVCRFALVEKASSAPSYRFKARYNKLPMCMRMAKIWRFAGSIKEFLVQRKKTVLLIIVVAVSTLLLSSLISVLMESYYNVNLPSVGHIKTIGVEVYMDEQLENKSEDIHWGTVYPGLVTNVTRYVRSISNDNINLSMTVENWQYHNSSGIVLNNTASVYLHWDLEGTTLKPAQHVRAVFTLDVNYSIDFINFVINNQVDSFSFGIKISPQELNVAKLESVAFRTGSLLTS